MYYGRDTEIEELKQHFKFSSNDKNSLYIINGLSGSGKTELIKEVCQQVYSHDKEAFILYIDVINDGFESNKFFENLLKGAYVPTQFRRNLCLSIPQKYSFSNYLRKQKLTNLTLKHSFRLIRSFIAFDTTYKKVIDYPWEEVITAIKEGIFENDLYLRYFSHVSKKIRLNIIIDNYQFLSEDIKIKFEDDFNTLQSGISLTIINRTNDKLKSIDKLDTLDNYTPTVLNLSYLTEDECKLLIRNKIALLDNVKLNQIWQITQGNYKDIELITNRLIDNPNSELFNISDIYDKLPDIQKNILIISSIFPAGMRKDIVFNYIKSILDENTEVADSLKSLIDAGFVYINGDTNDKIKISHESIVNGILNHTNASDLQLVTNNLKIYLEQTILSIGVGGELAYLIHCLINICNIEELRQNVEYIKQLLEIEYRKNSYFYIVSLSKKILHLIELLPEKYLHYILNSYQWISDFNGGLAILNSLQNDNYSKDLQLYYPRFQIQKYEFEEALKSLEKLENCSGTLLYKLNAYGHLGKDREAIKLLNESMNSVEKDDFYYIILRNSAHYFPTKEATENLKLALDYFQRNEYQIPVATVYNNLGVVNIWDGEYDIALENLNKATKILKKYNSNEIFEPYCNKSIIFLMNKNYQQSLKFINKSLQECPKALTLDIRMLKLNKLIIELISERISFTEFQNSLKNFEEEIPLIDDPWYKFQIVYNLQQFDDIPFVCEKTYIDDYQDGLTKYYLLIPYKNYNFCIGLSPNWRY